MISTEERRSKPPPNHRFRVVWFCSLSDWLLTKVGWIAGPRWITTNPLYHNEESSCSQDSELEANYASNYEDSALFTLRRLLQDSDVSDEDELRTLNIYGCTQITIEEIWG